MELIIIAALSKNNVIGKDNNIPWHISEDFKRFKALTSGHTIIMGRKTWDSLPIKPLPNRENIILTHNTEYSVEGVFVFNNFSDVIKHCEDKEKVFIIGGSRVYEKGLKISDTLELTRIHKQVEGDKFFPKIKFDDWELVNEEKRVDEKEGKYSFLTYKRTGEKDEINE